MVTEALIRPRITMLSPGGTIAMAHGRQGVVPRFGPKQLLANVSDLDCVVQIEAGSLQA